MTDSVVKALFLPFMTEQISSPGEGRALFLNAQAGEGLELFPSLVCDQPWKGPADALTAAGYAVADDETVSLAATYDVVLVILGKSRDEARCDLARAFRAAREGGLVVCVAENANGAGRLQTFFEQLGGPAHNLSKHKCRVFWTEKNSARIDAALLADWLSFGDVQPVDEGRFVSRPGLFSWDRVDPGSRLLVDTMNAEKGVLSGKGADLGCGAGFLSGALLESGGKAIIEAIDADRRALDVAQRNLETYVTQKRLSFWWHDISQGLEGRRYAWIVSNPPFHEGRETRASLGESFIAAAAGALMPMGFFWMVANRHLPYEKAMNAHFPGWTCVAEQDGFKVLCGRMTKRKHHGRA